MQLLYSKNQEKEFFNKFITACKDNFDLDDISKSFPRMILKIFFKLNDETIEESLKGLGSNDEGLDAFFIDEIKETYYLIQFKSRKAYNENQNKDAKKDWFSLLDKITDHFNNNKFISTNPRIMEIKKEINEDLYNYKFQKIIYHLGSCSETIINNYEHIEYLNQEEILNKFVQYYEEDLEEEDNLESLELTIETPNSKHVNEPNNFIYFKPKGSRKTIIFPLNGIQIIDLLKNGTTIFNRNIRGFLGEDHEVNKNIITTAKQNPIDFYYYNNGITITCDKFEINSLMNNYNPKLILSKPQIINGAQTVNSILCAYNGLLKEQRKKLSNEKMAIDKVKEHFKDILIICKVIENEKGENAKLTQNITKYSNSQNKIKFSDFYSNRIEQKKLKEIFTSFDITYIIKRGMDKTKNKESISMETLAENYWAQNINPFNAKNSDIFSENFNEDSSETMYYKIFNNKISFINENKRAFLKTYYIYDITSKIFKNIKKNLIKMEELKLANIENDIIKFINDLDKENNGLYYFTNSKSFVSDYLNIKNKKEVTKNNILKYIDFMEMKALTYIISEIIKNSYFKREDEQQIRINEVFNRAIDQKDIVSIKKMLNKITKIAFKIYAKTLNELKPKVNNDIELSLKFRKTTDNIKSFKDIVNNSITDLEEDFIVYEF